MQNPDTQLPANPESSHEGASWWLWIAWIEREGGGGFAYGCAARTFRAPGWSDEVGYDVPGGGRLIAHQCTISEERFSLVRDWFDAGMVDTAALQLSKAIQAKITDTRTIIQDGFGQSAVRTTLHYTIPNVDALVGTADGALEGVLSILQDQLNLPFKAGYAGHLGNFEEFQLHSWLDASQPFLIEFAPIQDASGGVPQTMEICRSAVFAAEEHIAHIVGRVNGEVVLDRLVRLPAGDRRVAFQVQESLDQYDFRLFSDGGEVVLHSEQQSFINRIGMVMAPIGGQLTVEDDLSHRAKSKDKELGSQAANVVLHSSHRSMIGAPREGSWRKFVEDMEQTVAAHLPKSSEDKWFPRGIEGEIGAIAHLNGLLNTAQIKGAVLVDPWFGAEALQRLVLRLGSQGVLLTILTSWTDIDPDTDMALDPDANPTAKLEAALRRLAPFMTPRLTMLNLVDGKDRAFHDRYLLLYPHEQPPKVFILSNSINKLAGNWPFAMSLLAPDAGRDVQRYIEALSTGRDSAKNKPLTISFRWPSNAT